MRNSKSFDKRSPGELAEISRRAGIASGAARRRKRELIEQEKIHDAAMREMRRENISTITSSVKVLLNAQKEYQIR